EYRITGEGSGRPLLVAGPPSPATRLDPAVPLGGATADPGRFAGPEDARLEVGRDGIPVAVDRAPQLPEVAVLVTDLTRPAGPDAPLSVALRLDDESASRPSPAKIVLIAAALVAWAAAGALLAVAGRGPPRSPARSATTSSCTTRASPRSPGSTGRCRGGSRSWASPRSSSGCPRSSRAC